MSGTLAAGSLFTAEDVAARAQVAVIDTRTRDTLFGAGANPLDAVLLVGRVPLRIVGVVNPPAGFGGNDSLNVYMPYTTAQTRLLGSTVLRGITLRVADDADIAATEQAVTALLAERHGRKDFFIVNTDEIRQTITATNRDHGGANRLDRGDQPPGRRDRGDEPHARLGERADRRDRRADGGQRAACRHPAAVPGRGGAGFRARRRTRRPPCARQRRGARRLRLDLPLASSLAAIVLAVATSTGIGVFGYLPARRAARLDPVRALSPA